MDNDRSKNSRKEYIFLEFYRSDSVEKTGIIFKPDMVKITLDRAYQD